MGRRQETHQSGTMRLASFGAPYGPDFQFFWFDIHLLRKANKDNRASDNNSLQSGHVYGFYIIAGFFKSPLTHPPAGEGTKVPLLMCNEHINRRVGMFGYIGLLKAALATRFNRPEQGFKNFKSFF